MTKEYLPEYSHVNKVFSIHYHDVDIKIFVEPCSGLCAHTNNMYECGLNGCKEFIDGSQDTAHLIDKHTTKELLERYGLINKLDN
jgi:hypothetical protein